MNNAEYHADTSAISASGLKLFMRSPAHYWHAYLNPNKPPRHQTPAMMLGTAAHCAILEPERFSAEYAVIPDGIDRRTNAGKQAYADLLATGATLLTGEQMAQIQQMATAFRSNTISAAIFQKPHKVEQSFFADVNGVSCKCRPDFMTNDGLFVMDLKTTSDASPDAFGRSAWNLGYHIQAAFYRRVIMAATGIAPDFMFGCVESDAPHMVAHYHVPQSLIDYADGVIDSLLSQYAECLSTNNWPGYAAETEPQSLSIPGFAQRIIEQDGIDEWEISHV